MNQTIEVGGYEIGVETVIADSLAVADRETLYDREAWNAMATASMHAEDDVPEGGAWH